MENIFDSWIVNKYIAHRGLHNESIPENSLASFKNAIKSGYAIELDVRLTGDGEVVVFHDDKLERLTGKDKCVETLPLEEIKKMKLLDSEETIPTFEEVLKLVNGKTPILVEIKSTNSKVGNLESKVLKLLKAYNGEYAIESFNPYSLKWFLENAPEIKRGILSCYFKNEKLSFAKKFILKRLRMNRICKPNFIAYDGKKLPNRWVTKCENELPVIAWNITSQQEYLEVVKYSDNVIFEGFEPNI